jgi:hypothetical protein
MDSRNQEKSCFSITYNYYRPIRVGQNQPMKYPTFIIEFVTGKIRFELSKYFGKKSNKKTWCFSATLLHIQPVVFRICG